MSEKNNEPSDWIKKLFSTQGILIAILVLGIYWVFFGGEQKEKTGRVSYTPQSVPIGVSEQLNADALEKLGVDLTEHLDPKLIPAVMSEALKETSQANVSEQDFLPTLVSKVSNKIRDISTIDLNNDGLADPVLVVPQTETGDEDFLVFSILVPDPATVGKLPSGSEQEAWRDIVENKSIEIMTASVVRSSEEQMTMQSAPNPQMYQNAGAPYPPYYSTGPSMTSILMTSMMMSMLFRPAYPMGFGGYGYSQRTVTSVQSNRGAATSSLNKAAPSSSAAKTAGGKSVSANKFRSTSTKSLNKVKSNQFRSANRKASGGGFGSSAKRSAAGKPAATQRRSAPRKKSFGFGGSRRSSRGFGFGRRRR